jgi:hypothetical protein
MWWTAPAPGIEVPYGGSSETNHMRAAVHMQISTIGLDIAKNVLQIHGIDAVVAAAGGRFFSSLE